MRRKYRCTAAGPTVRRSSKNIFDARSIGTITVFTSVNNGPASVSCGFNAVIVPTYTPGAASAERRYATRISVVLGPAATLSAVLSHGTFDRKANSAERRPARGR